MSSSAQRSKISSPYCFITASDLSPEAAEAAREKVRETERLLAEARWETLRYQVNPHFLLTRSIRFHRW